MSRAERRRLLDEAIKDVERRTWVSGIILVVVIVGLLALAYGVI